LSGIDRMPFAVALAQAAEEWTSNAESAAFEMVALSLIRSCGLIGVFGDAPLYRRAAGCLTFDKAFLVTFLAGACFKVRSVAARVNLGEWTDSQYACMRRLDHFEELGESSWG
jgi:hypothetical protein